MKKAYELSVLCDCEISGDYNFAIFFYFLSYKLSERPVDTIYLQFCIMLMTIYF